MSYILNQEELRRRQKVMDRLPLGSQVIWRDPDAALYTVHGILVRCQMISDDFASDLVLLVGIDTARGLWEGEVSASELEIHNPYGMDPEIDKQKAEVKPCELPCPKCGSLDILRQFRYKDEAWYDHAVQTKPHYQRVEVDDGWRTALEDLIIHHCRTCQFEWDSLPLN